uniref:Uncharacterized protein n=1 Tax=Sphaerodactylus townsendi TaxID=933632 RepID=A0ACB8G0M6_9SAUR
MARRGPHHWDLHRILLEGVFLSWLCALSHGSTKRPFSAPLLSLARPKYPGSEKKKHTHEVFMTTDVMSSRFVGGVGEPPEKAIWRVVPSLNPHVRLHRQSRLDESLQAFSWLERTNMPASHMSSPVDSKRFLLVTLLQLARSPTRATQKPGPGPRFGPTPPACPGTLVWSTERVSTSPRCDSDRCCIHPLSLRCQPG